MRATHSQAGIGHLAAVLVVVIVAVVGFAGYTVWKAGQTAHDTATTTTATTDGMPATIKTKADLTKTGQFLDATASQLNSSLNPSSLDSDINQML